jgi:hypothetical protein
MRALVVAGCVLIVCAQPLRAERPSGSRAMVVGVFPVE